MEVKILWTDFALSQLEDIYDFYKYKASPRTAKKIIKLLIEETISLESNPLLGVKDVEYRVSRQDLPFRDFELITVLRFLPQRAQR
jgi:toxin ParE1/3/4